MCRKIIPILLTFLLVLTQGAWATRIKDIAQIEGVRSNQLVGYGLVVGLDGSGDSASTQFTVQSLVNMMERLGVTVDRSQVKVDNVAAVIVTADLPAFSKPGGSIDVSVSSIGDADSLIGGTLMMTPLKGPDGNVYAVAQGPLVVGALAFGGEGAKVQKNHPTAGRIPNGGLVERSVPLPMTDLSRMTYRLQRPDFTTAKRMSLAINEHFQTGVAEPVDGGSLAIHVPRDYRGRIVDFVAELESLEVVPDTGARIVVNEKTGTIVMGEDVRIATIAVSHGNLSLVISENFQVSQPEPFSEGETVVVPETNIQLSEDSGNLIVLERGVTISDVAQALNAIGATPRDLIAIFQAIKAAGALHAELVIL